MYQNTTRVEHGHHRQHGGRASVRPYSRDDMWEALACQKLVVQRVAEGFRPLTVQERGAQITLAEPTVEIDPLTIPMEVDTQWFRQLADLTDESHGGARRNLPRPQTRTQTATPHQETKVRDICSSCDMRPQLL